jgi:hypothetical protein
VQPVTAVAAAEADSQQWMQPLTQQQQQQQQQQQRQGQKQQEEQQQQKAGGQPKLLPPDRQFWVHPARWAANITDMRQRLQNVRLSAFSIFKDAQWQIAQKVVAAAAPAVVVLAHVEEGLVGYEQQLCLLLSKLSVGHPALGNTLGLWLHGLGEAGDCLHVIPYPMVGGCKAVF